MTKPACLVVAIEVAALVRQRIPTARVEARMSHWDAMVSLRYPCPCGETSGMTVCLSEHVPAEYAAARIVESLRAHVIGEGNVPDFQ